MEVEFKLNGKPVRCPEGITLAGAMYLLGRRVMRETAWQRAPRSIFCGMGLCFECLMYVDGRPNVRACQTLVRQGMEVEVQQGNTRLERVL